MPTCCANKKCKLIFPVCGRRCVIWNSTLCGYIICRVYTHLLCPFIKPFPHHLRTKCFQNLNNCNNRNYDECQKSQKFNFHKGKFHFRGYENLQIKLSLRNLDVGSIIERSSVFFWKDEMKSNQSEMK